MRRSRCINQKAEWALSRDGLDGETGGRKKSRVSLRLKYPPTDEYINKTWYM